MAIANHRPAAHALLFVSCLSLWCTTHVNSRLTNVVTDWIEATQEVVTFVGAHEVTASRWYALLSTAIYNSVVTGQGKAPDVALAAYAGHAINSGFFPWNQPSKYDALIKRQLEDVKELERKAAADIALPISDLLLKASAGGEMIRWANFKPAPPGTTYAYQFGPNQTFVVHSQGKNATPWLLTYEEADAIAYNNDPSKGPVFQPSRFDYLPTALLGEKDSRLRTQEQSDIAKFWASSGNTSTTAGLWLNIAREVLPTKFSIPDTALFYARASLANWDARLINWRVKYTTLHWRPTVAFRQGYPGFNAIPNWTALIRLPNNPEYPSGHTTTGGAVWEALLRTLDGKEDITFSIDSQSAPWVGKRTFSSLKQASDEAALSRLYAGVHFPTANNDGVTMGRYVTSWVWDRVKPGSPVVLQKPRS